MVLTETARQPKQYLTRQLTPTTSELIWLRIWKIIIVKLIFHCKLLISKMENIIFDYEMFLGPVWLFYLGWLGRHLPKQGRSQRKLTSVHYKFTKNRWEIDSNHPKISIFFFLEFFFLKFRTGRYNVARQSDETKLAEKTDFRQNVARCLARKRGSNFLFDPIRHLKKIILKCYKLNVVNPMRQRWR